MFTAYDIESGLRIGMFEHLIEFMNKINDQNFEKVLQSEEYRNICSEFKVKKTLFCMQELT